MSCTHCPHCRALDEAGLTLPDPPSMRPGADGNLPFYRAFGLAYDHARALHLRPRAALMSANPWLTDSQCRTYLQRARVLGFVTTAARRPNTTPDQRPDVAPAPVPDWTPAESGAVWMHPDVNFRIRGAWAAGNRVTAQMLQVWYPGTLTMEHARATLDRAVASGLAHRDGDGVVGVQDQAPPWRTHT